MAQRLRYEITSKLFDVLNVSKQESKQSFLKLMATIELKKSTESHEQCLQIPITDLNKVFKNKPFTNEAIQNHFPKSVINNNLITFSINKDELYKETFSPMLERKNMLSSISEPQKILVEFSSPNIAKPFHVGHLRSTIIGNFIGNLFKSLNHNVVRLNYLGDWGTQFGFLSIGMNRLQFTDEQMRTNPIRHLFEAYVYANKIGEAKDSEVAVEARKIFSRLENGTVENLDKWKEYRMFTVDELRVIYSRLGVEFDEYCWESDYCKVNINRFLNDIIDSGHLVKDADGKFVMNVNDKQIPLIKSDGTTLYLTRDIAALSDRYARFKFDRMLYIVDNGQFEHFESLKQIASQLSLIENANEKVEHVKFGRIKKMSTRKGNVVFLKDILDEAHDIMLQKQKESKTTKVSAENLQNSETTDILGISAVIINDLKQRRQRDYDFNWNQILQVNGDTGIKLQYTHCRLCNLKDVTGVEPAESFDIGLLSEPIAQQLVYELAKYSEILLKCQLTLEACILVNYLFQLSNTTSKALKLLNVKNADSKTQAQRMLLFWTAKHHLHDGMKILGLKPLLKM